MLNEIAAEIIGVRLILLPF